MVDPAIVRFESFSAIIETVANNVDKTRKVASTDEDEGEKVPEKMVLGKEEKE
jgi:hypothetical protein